MVSLNIPGDIKLKARIYKSKGDKNITSIYQTR